MKSFYYLGMLLTALTLGLMSCSEEEEHSNEFSLESLLKETDTDYQNYLEQHEEISIEVVTLEEMNKFNKEYGMPELSKKRFHPQRMEVLTKPK